MSIINGRYKICESGCWEWIGCRSTGGYGKLTYKQKRYSSHRASWIDFNGQIPDGKCVLHKCDNRLCVNPEHLYLGDHYQNMQDRRLRERTYRQRFFKEDKKKITELYLNGVSQVKLAKQFKTTQGHISRLVKSYIENKSIP